MTGVRIGQQQQSQAVQDLTTKVQRLTSPGPAFSDPTTIFRATQGPEPNHLAIAFRIAALPGVSAVQVYRNTTRDFGTATQLAEYSAEVSETKLVNAIDIVNGLSGKTIFYWLRIMPLNTNATPIVHGPQPVVVP